MGKDSKKKHSKEKDKSEKSKKDHKHKSKHHDRDKGEDKQSKIDIPISIDDFFHKSEEFRVWLKISKGVYFEDLTSKDARKLFEKDFVKDFNKGKLNKMYYDGNIPLEIRNSAVKTQHKWGFKLSKNEETQLADLTEDVDIQTRAPTDKDKLGTNTGSTSSNAYSRPTTSAPSGGGVYGPASGSGIYGPASGSGIYGPTSGSGIYGPTSGSGIYGPASGAQSRLQADNDWDQKQSQRAQQRLQQKSTSGKLMEELLPGRETAGSKEARRDQKRAAGEALHGAHRDKEEARDGLAMSEKSLLGGDNRDEYNRMMERERMYKDRRAEKAMDRSRELQGRADEREMTFMQKLGIDPSKGRITIAPREN